MPQASSLAATIKQEFDIESELIRGSHGIFDVRVDGQLIFSKDDQGRFPQHDEVVELIRQRTN